MSSPTRSSTPDTELLRPAEVGAELRVSRASVYRLIASGQIPSVAVGERKATRISRADLAAYIAKHRTERAS